MRSKSPVGEKRATAKKKRAYVSPRERRGRPCLGCALRMEVVEFACAMASTRASQGVFPRVAHHTTTAVCNPSNFIFHLAFRLTLCDLTAAVFLTNLLRKSSPSILAQLPRYAPGLQNQGLLPVRSCNLLLTCDAVATTSCGNFSDMMGE